MWEPAVTKHKAEAVKRQLEAAAAVKEAGESSASSSSPTEASVAKSAKMRKENADAEVDALNSLDKKFRDSNGGGGTGGDPGKQGVHLSPMGLADFRQAQSSESEPQSKINVLNFSPQVRCTTSS